MTVKQHNSKGIGIMHEVFTLGGCVTLSFANSSLCKKKVCYWNKENSFNAWPDV